MKNEQDHVGPGSKLGWWRDASVGSKLSYVWLAVTPVVMVVFLVKMSNSNVSVSWGFVFGGLLFTGLVLDKVLEARECAEADEE